MRTYGRVIGPDGSYVRDPNGYIWWAIETASDGDNSNVWITTLCQEIKLNLNEAPFYANHGIAAQASVITQVFPDLYMTLIQQRYSQYFASLIISRLPGTTPTYNVAVTTFQGAQISMTVAQ